MRNLLLFFAIICLLTACSDEFFEQTIDIDPPQYEKKLVTHVLIDNLDSVFTLPLTRNFGILDQISDSAWIVKNALVEVYEDGQLKLTVLTDLSEERGYSAPLTPGFFQAGKTYELRASHPDFTAVLARQVMPGPFQIDSATYRENGGISDEGEKLSAIDVYIQDQPSRNNYYVVGILGVYNQIIPIFDEFGNVISYDTIPANDYNTLYPAAPEDPNVREAAGNVFAVSDQFFAGQAYKFTFRFSRGTGYSRFRAQVWSVTEDYFRYIISAQRQYEIEDLPLVEPVTVHHNLEHGIGIFGLGWEQVVEVH